MNGAVELNSTSRRLKKTSLIEGVFEELFHWSTELERSGNDEADEAYIPHAVEEIEQIDEQVVEVVEVIPHASSSQRIQQQTVDIPVPQRMEVIMEVAHIIPQKQVHQRTVEHIDDIVVLPFKEEGVVVMQYTPQGARQRPNCGVDYGCCCADDQEGNREGTSALASRAPPRTNRGASFEFPSAYFHEQ